MQRLLVLLVSTCVLLLPVTYASADVLEIINVKTYSSGGGTRSARVTVKCCAGAASTITEAEEFKAIFSDGSEKRGIGPKGTIRIRNGETTTILVEFGNHKYPIEDVKYCGRFCP